MCFKDREYVEIGGVKWATMNVGATRVTDAGLYFQWGDIHGYTASQVGSGSGKKYFGWQDYKYCDGTSSTMTKYNSTDGKTVLDLSDDAARANWGGGWRIPTTEEYIALGNAVNTEWVTNYQGSGINGRLMTDKTDNSKTLFFPIAGYCNNGKLNDTIAGYYLSSSIDSNSFMKAYRLNFYSGGITWQGNGYRAHGYSVRAILDK